MRALLFSLPLAAALAVAPPAPAPAQISLFNMRNSLVQFALEKISTPGEMEITAQDVTDSEDGGVELVGVAVSDRNGAWLKIGALGLDWSAQRILLGELQINRLFARDVEVLRPPLSEDVAVEAREPAEPRGLFDWPRAPLATRIDALTLDNVTIAPGVIAPETGIAFDATGAAQDEGDIQAARLDITRVDSVSGEIALDYERNFDANTMRLILDAREAAGGIVAALAGLPPTSAAIASINADGPLTDWRATLAMEAEQVLSAAGEATIVVGPPLAIDAVVTATPGPELDPQIAGVLGERAEIVAKVQETDEQVIVIEQARITSPELHLEAGGTFARQTGAFDAEIDLTAESGLADLVEGVEFGGAGFKGSVKGDLAAFAADGALSLKGLRTETVDVGEAALDVAAQKDGAKVGFDLSGDLAGLRVDKLQPSVFGSPTLAAKGLYDPDSALTLERLQFDSPQLQIAAAGTLAADGGAAGVDYSLATSDLGPLAEPYGQDASGRLRMTGRLDGPLSAPRLAGRLAAEGLAYQGEDYGEVRLAHDAVLGPTPEGTAAVQALGSRFGPVSFDGAFRFADQVLHLTGMEATGLDARVAGDVHYALATGLAKGEIRLDAPDLAAIGQALGEPLRGVVRGDVTLIPQDEAQDAEVDLSIARLRGFGATLEAAAVKGRLLDLLGAPGFKGRAVAREAGYAPLDASLGLARFEGEATDLAGRLAVDGAVTLERAAYGPHGVGALDLDLYGRDLLTDRPVVAATGGARDLSSSGFTLARLALDAALEDEAEGTARADIRAEGLRGDGVSLASATLTGGASAVYTGQPDLDARLVANRANAGPVSLSQTTLVARGPLSSLALALDAQGSGDVLPKEGREALSLTSRATVNATDPAGVKATISRLSASAGGERIALTQPMRLALGDSTTVSDLRMTLPGGALSGAVTVHPDGLAGDLALRLDDAARLASLASAPLQSGSARLNAKFDTRPGAARADLTMSADGLRVEGFDPEVGLNANGRWRGGPAALDVALLLPGIDAIRASAAVPLRPGMPPSLPSPIPLDARLQWQGEIGDLWAMVPTADHVLDGYLDLDLRVRGSASAPRVSGDIALRDGSYQFLTAGTILTDLAAQTKVAPDGGFELDLTADDGSGHPVTAVVTVSPSSRLDAKVTTQNAVLVRRDDVTARISADIAATGPLVAPAIKGDVVVDGAEVRLVNATPPSVRSLGDIRIKRAPRPEPEEGAGAAIPLDIRVRAPGDVFVRGRGLDSEWEIAMEIGGTAADPAINGRIERRRGTLSLVGALFELDQGLIRFDGGADPQLQIAAVTERDGVKGGVYVRGRASDPKITFESNPTLPQGEVLPRLLFGKSQQSLSPSEALSLAAGVATLLDGSGGVLDGVRAAAGVDVLRVDLGPGGPAVTAGKNLSDDVFVGVTQPIGGGSAKVKVEVDVFENVTVDSEVGEASSVGVNWKKDF